MTTRILLAIAILVSLAACKIGGGTESPSVAADCRPVASLCGSNADCCSYGCQGGQCVPNPLEGGACRTSDDCAYGLCKSHACSATATCRDDSDVCTSDFACCSGNCVGLLAGAECQPNHAPVADVGLAVPGTTVPYRRAVPLRNGSSDPDAGDTLYYEWSVTSRPVGSIASIAIPNSSAIGYVPQFVPDVIGPYELQVRIVDGTGAHPGRLAVVASVAFTAEDTVPVARPRASNTTPPAVPGTVGHVPRRNTVTLDGTTSDDPDGDAVVSWQWQILSQPVGGEATLLNATAATASLVLPTAGAPPEGDYVLRLVVRNAKTGYADIVVHADDTTPVAALAAPAEANNLTTLTLDASASADADHDALQYAWQVTAGPAGSVAAPVPAAGGQTATFTPDLPGAYTVEVTVSDPALHADPASRSLTVYKAVRDLGHRVVDAEYSSGRDRIVAVGPHPDTVAHPGEGVLNVVDPRAAAPSPSAQIVLPKVPTCVGLSPDGNFAVVGFAKAISYVDLRTTPATLVATVALNYDVSDAVLGSTRNYKGGTPHFAHFLFSGAPSDQPVQTLILGTLPEIVVGTPGNYVPPTSRMKIRPEPLGTVSRLFVAAYPHTNAGWWGYNIDSSTGATYGLPANWPLTGFYAGVWVAEDGSLVFNENGRVYYGRSGTTTTELLEAGVLGGGAPSVVEAIDHSTEAGLILAVDGVTQQTLKAYSDTSFGAAWTVTLPRWVAKGVAGRGRFAFFNAAGTERYAIVSSATGTSTDAALVVYCPDALGVDPCP